MTAPTPRADLAAAGLLTTNAVAGGSDAGDEGGDR